VGYVTIFAIIAFAVLIAGGFYAAYVRRQRLAEAPPAEDDRRAVPGSPVAREVRAVTDWLLAVAFEQTGCAVSKDTIACRRIREAAEIAVRDLETQVEVQVSLPALTQDATGPKDLEVRLTRESIAQIVET